MCWGVAPLGAIPPFFVLGRLLVAGGVFFGGVDVFGFVVVVLLV
jgi:hypothetical protein